MADTEQEYLRRLEALPPDQRQKLIEATVERFSNIKFVPNPGPQTDAYFSKADELLYGGSAGSGKQLCVDTAIPVPLSIDSSGFKKMGDMQVGDLVFSPSGEPVPVIAVSDIDRESESYAVEFDTGEVIYADSRHLWKTMTNEDRTCAIRRNEDWRAARRGRRKSRAVALSQKPWVSKSITEINKKRIHEYLEAPTGDIKTTDEIRNTIDFRGRRNHSIAVCDPLVLPEIELPIEPYLLGLWLGDGMSAKGEVGMSHTDFLQLDQYMPPIVSEIIETKGRKNPFCIRRFVGLQKTLRLNGLLGNKHIPTIYKRASLSQRIALLQGLMDTDGTCKVGSGNLNIGFSNEKLTNDVYDLLGTLGIKCKITVKIPTIYGRACNKHYKIGFTAPFCVFRLPRKAVLQTNISSVRNTTRRRYIYSIKSVGIRPMRCIQVGKEDGLYLVGRSCIPTHNSGLINGLALTQHSRSLIMRRKYSDLSALTDDLVRMYGSRDGFTTMPRPRLRATDGRVIEFGACQHLGDEEGFQGQAHDLKAFDEVTQFLESQVRYIIGWNRTAEEGQRCRVVYASNPPTSSDGDWIIGRFRPWLDPTYHNPAKPGELRWVVTDPDGKDIWVDGPEPVSFPGRAKPTLPKSRTFIPGKLSDNPYLANTNYAATLDAMPEPLRSAMRDGNFMMSRSDTENQLIPTRWVREAMMRWKEEGRTKSPMTAMGADVADGGADDNVLAKWHEYWMDKMPVVPGKEAPDGSDVAALIVKHRRDGCDVGVDMGGGYGGAPKVHLEDSGIGVKKFKGALGTEALDEAKVLGFVNTITEAYWRMREALDPDQAGGSKICLPEDQELLSDLTAYTYEVDRYNGRLCVKKESKKDVKKRLGRSTNKGDACVIGWYINLKALSRIAREKKPGGGVPKANVGYANRKSRRH